MQMAQAALPGPSTSRASGSVLFAKAQLALWRQFFGSTILMIHFLGSLSASSRMEWTRPVTDTPDRLIRIGIPLNWAARQRLASEGWVVSNVCISGSLRAHVRSESKKAGGRDAADLSMRLPAQESGAVAACDNRGRVCLIKDYHLPRRRNPTSP